VTSQEQPKVRTNATLVCPTTYHAEVDGLGPMPVSPSRRVIVPVQQHGGSKSSDSLAVLLKRHPARGLRRHGAFLTSLPLKRRISRKDFWWVMRKRCLWSFR